MIKKLNTLSQITTIVLLSFLLSSCRINKNESTEWDKQVDLSGTWKFSIGDDSTWIKPSYNDQDWEKIKVPSPWENEGFHGYNGYAWYRKHFVFPAGAKDKGLYLRLGIIDDVDAVYVNGHFVGATGSFPPNYETAYYNSRSYPLVGEFLNIGSDNIISVRVYDNELEGGILSGDIGIFTIKDYLVPDIPLEGVWKFNTGDSLTWKEKSYTDTGWQNITVPANWESQGHSSYDGFAWYRKNFFVPKEFSGKKLIIAAGKIDDFDQVYINGKLVGSMGNFRNFTALMNSQSCWQEFRGYDIPDTLLIAGGNNVIAVRVFDQGLGGGIYQGPVGIVTQERFTKFWRNRNN